MRRWIHKPSSRVLIILIVVAGFSFSLVFSSYLEFLPVGIRYGTSPNFDGVRSSYPADQDRAVDLYFQLRLVGRIFRFNWLDPSKVSVTWSVSGCGNYSSLTVDGSTMPNTAVDIYLDEWVQI